MQSKQPLSFFQVFSLCAAASLFGLSVSSGGMTPAYFLLTVLLFLLQGCVLRILGRTFRRSESTDAGHILSDTLSAPIAGAVLLFAGILFALRSSVTLSLQTDSISLYLLEDTSGFAVMLVLLATVLFVMLPGLRRISGISTLLFLTTVPIVALIAIAGLFGIDWGALRVLYQFTADEAVRSLPDAALTASGAQCALFFLGRADQKAYNGAAAASFVCAGLFTLMLFVTVGTIGVDGMLTEQFPFVSAAGQINLGGIELTERFDMPLVIVYLLASIAQISILTLCAAVSIASALRLRSTGTTAIILLPAEFLAAMLLQYTDLDRTVYALCAVGFALLGFAVIPVVSVISKLRCREVKE